MGRVVGGTRGGHDPHVGRGHHEGFSSPLEQVEVAGRLVLHGRVHVAAIFVVNPAHLLPLLGPGAHNAVDGADGGDVDLVADAVLEEAVPDLPGEDARVLLLVVFYLEHHFGGGHFRLAATYHPRLDRPSLVVPEE